MYSTVGTVRESRRLPAVVTTSGFSVSAAARTRRRVVQPFTWIVRSTIRIFTFEPRHVMTPPRGLEDLLDYRLNSRIQMHEYGVCSGLCRLILLKKKEEKVKSPQLLFN